MTASADVDRCLDDRLALDLVAGQLDPTTSEHARRHLDRCDDCQVLVAMIAAGSSVPPSVGTIAAAVWPARGDDYRVGREIARGGMGVVLSAHHRWLGRDVAIKLAERGDPARFAREVRIAARLQHPAIVPVYDAGTIDGTPFYAMRPIDGEPLDVRIKRADGLAGRLALLPHVVAAADAIAYAHVQRVIHRDLKPSNILVGSFGETQVIDWGLAREDAGGDVDDRVPAPAADGDPDVTRTGAIMGTPAYMAPEQARGERADARSDVFALGAILFELLVGASPASGAVEVVVAARAAGEPIAVRDRAAGAPAELIAIAERALEPDADRRYANGGELAADLHRLQAGLLVAAHRYTAGQLVRRWLGRHRALFAAIVTGAVVAAGLGGFLLSRLVSERNTAERERDIARVERTSAEQLVIESLGDAARALQAAGDHAALAKLGDQLVAYYDRVLAVRPDDPRSRGWRAISVGTQADAAFATGDFARAETLWIGVLDAMRELTTVDREAVRDLGIVYYNLGSIARMRGDGAAAEQWFERAIAELAPQLAARPGLVASPLAGSHDGIAQARLERLDTAGAREPAERAVAAVKLAVADSPDDVLFQLRGASEDVLLGTIAGLDGRRAEAVQAFTSGIATVDALRTKYADDPELASSAAYQRIGLAMMALSAGDLAETDRLVAEMRAALADAHELGASDAALAGYTGPIAAIEAQRELVANRPAAAALAAARAVAAYAAAAEAMPEEVRPRLDHARALGLHARALAAAGRRADARATMTAAVAAFESLATDPRGALERARTLTSSALLDVSVDGRDPAALLAQVSTALDELDAAPIAQPLVDHGRAYAAAVAAHRGGDPGARARYTAARAALAGAMPMVSPTLGELDRIAGHTPVLAQ